jgi:hypothetical protein
MCAIDKATLAPLMDYWVPEVGVAGVHEMVGNALVMTGEKDRLTDLRGQQLINTGNEETIQQDIKEEIYA